MLKVLSEKEVETSWKEVDEFLLSLDKNIKSDLVFLLKPLIKQLNCNHDFLDLDSYENSFPKKQSNV